MAQFNTRVLIKEPRGIIRILQFFFGQMAYFSTYGFSTISILHIDCPEGPSLNVEYKIKYPFDLRTNEIYSPYNCSDDTNLVSETFPIDFSATAMLFTLIISTSTLYALLSLAYYCFCTAKYETNPLAPMVDLCITLLFAILLIFVTCLWALNVSDLKHYTHPHYFSNYLGVCQDSESNCQPVFPGKWSSLSLSIGYSASCAIFWLGSTWYIFKETTLHKKQAYQAPTQPQ